MTATLKLPATEPYRVCIAGAIYSKPTEGLNDQGKPVVVMVRELATFGQQVDLITSEAVRLTGLGAVKPADAPLSYEEMDDDQLTALAKSRGVEVRGSGANGEATREDLINTHRVYDQARGNASGVPTPAPAAEVSPDDAEFVADHSVDEVIAEAGDDQARAAQLLQAERGQEKPRKSLVEALEKTAAGD